jgi:hypothetical protein
MMYNSLLLRALHEKTGPRRARASEGYTVIGSYLPVLYPVTAHEGPDGSSGVIAERPAIGQIRLLVRPTS